MPSHGKWKSYEFLSKRQDEFVKDNLMALKNFNFRLVSQSFNEKLLGITRTGEVLFSKSVVV